MGRVPRPAYIEECTVSLPEAAIEGRPAAMGRMKAWFCI